MKFTQPVCPASGTSRSARGRRHYPGVSAGCGYLAKGLAIFALCWLAGKLSIEIRVLSGQSPLIWLPSGVGLAALTLFGLELWPAITLALLTVGTRMPHGPMVTALVAVGGTIGTTLGAYALRRAAGAAPTLSRVREVAAMVVLVMGCAAGIGVTIQITGYYLDGTIPPHRLFEVWRSWWLSEAMSHLVVGGACITFWNDALPRLRSKELRISPELALIAAAVAATAVLNYTGLVSDNPSTLLRPYSLFAFIIWASLRFDTTGSTLVTLIAATGMMYGRFHGYAPRSSVASEVDRAAIQQLFLLSLGTVGAFLSAAIREKQAALDLQNQFLATASHELKTPVTSLNLQVQLFAHRAQTGNAPFTADEQMRVVERMSRQVLRMNQVIERLFDVSRLERGEFILNLGRVGLAELVQSLVCRLSESLGSAGCRVAMDVPADIVGRWDGFRLEQVLENIVLNAIKYAPGSRITISAARHESTAQLVVRDTGPGIRAADQGRIFERFVRVDHRSRHAASGLGLGLFIAKQIISAHGGQIAVESILGEGTAFVIDLPLLDQIHADPPARPLHDAAELKI